MSNNEACKQSHETTVPPTVQPKDLKKQISNRLTTAAQQGSLCCNCRWCRTRTRSIHIWCQTGNDNVNPTHVAVPDSATLGTQFNFPQKWDCEVRGLSERIPEPCELCPGDSLGLYTLAAASNTILGLDVLDIVRNPSSSDKHDYRNVNVREQTLPKKFKWENKLKNEDPYNVHLHAAKQWIIFEGHRLQNKVMYLKFHL